MTMASAKECAPLETVAATYGITLPPLEQLPPSYTSLRMWLNRLIATLEGRHKRLWQQTKQDPERLQRVRDANKLRVQAYRKRRKASSSPLETAAI